MKWDLMEVDPCRRKLAVDVESADVQELTNETGSELRKNARVPGFRPGKAPLDVIKARYRAEIREEVRDQLIRKGLNVAIKEKEIDVLGSPRILEDKFADDGSFRFQVEFDIRPQFELPDYRAIRVERTKTEVADEQVNAEMEKLRERSAIFDVVEDRPLEKGDFAAMEVGGGTDPNSIPKPRAAFLQIDDDDSDPFNEKVLGMAIGEKREFQVTYSEEFSKRPQVAGQTVHYIVELKELRTRRLPELDDDLARDIGVDDLASLRERVTASLDAISEAQADAECRKKILDELEEKVNFELPKSLLEEEIEHRLRQLSQEAHAAAQAQGTEIDWNDVREKARPSAEKKVKIDLLLDEIANKESMELTPAELERAISEQAQNERITSQEARRKLEENHAVEQFTAIVLRQKVVDFLFGNATLKP